jgi:preprotein translocase SecE subunit
MAITRQKTDSLVEANIAGKSKNIEPKPLDSKPNSLPKVEKKERKPGFLKTTLEELKLVQWPTWKYVYKWSSIILLFTFVMSISLGLFDRIFTDGVKFVDCTSPAGQKRNVGDCGKDFWTNLTAR